MSENNVVRLPEVIVFAGPNGSGKSTITQMVKTGGEYINADDRLYIDSGESENGLRMNNLLPFSANYCLTAGFFYRRYKKGTKRKKIRLH